MLGNVFHKPVKYKKHAFVLDCYYVQDAKLIRCLVLKKVWFFGRYNIVIANSHCPKYFNNDATGAPRTTLLSRQVFKQSFTYSTQKREPHTESPQKRSNLTGPRG